MEQTAFQGMTASENTEQPQSFSSNHMVCLLCVYFEWIKKSKKIASHADI
jgi:hypothetical protein